jgi:hypothetical protein
MLDANPLDKQSLVLLQCSQKVNKAKISSVIANQHFPTKTKAQVAYVSKFAIGRQFDYFQ